MAYRMGEIAALLGGRVLGDPDYKVTGPAEPEKANQDQLALAMSSKYGPALKQGRAVAALIGADMDWQEYGLTSAIQVGRPRMGLSAVTSFFDMGPEFGTGIHATAIIHATAQIGDGAIIGPYTVVGPRAKIGKSARIASHVTIGADAQIGDDALIHSAVQIGARICIGHRVIIQPGAVIGSDGFSFVTPELNQVERARKTLGKQDTAGPAQAWMRIYSLGSVIIGDDVEIGGNCSIDRGTIANTTIGLGTKFDNLVHIGHNCVIGQDCLLCGQVGLAGSVVLGDRVVLGGQAGVSDHVILGNDVIAAGGAGVLSNVPAGRMVMGYPAVKMEQHVEIYKALRRLPRLSGLVSKLQKAVFKPSEGS